MLSNPNAAGDTAANYFEPITVWRRGKLEATISGDSDPKTIAGFARAYYSHNTKYRLVFGGGEAGSASVVKATTDTDCAKTNAEVALQTKTKLNKLVMALATNGTGKLPKTVRRRPTPDERSAVIIPVKEELGKQGVPASALRDLSFTNLTALDLDRDGKFEFVGSALVSGRDGEKHLLFFIAEDQGGEYQLGQANYTRLTGSDIQNNDTAVVNDGLLNELLVDVYDVDGDGVAEVFTYTASLEGAHFGVYQRKDGKWSKWFEGSNYHCAY